MKIYYNIIISNISKVKLRNCNHGYAICTKHIMDIRTSNCTVYNKRHETFYYRKRGKMHWAELSQIQPNEVLWENFCGINYYV